MYKTLPSELDLDTLVTVTFANGSTRTEIAGIFDWTTISSYILAE